MLHKLCCHFDETINQGKVGTQCYRNATSICISKFQSFCPGVEILQDTQHVLRNEKKTTCFAVKCPLSWKFPLCYVFQTCDLENKCDPGTPGVMSAAPILAQPSQPFGW